MNLFNMISGKKDKTQNDGLFQKITEQQEMAPEIEPIQVDEYGNIDEAATLNLRNALEPRTLWQHLGGRTLDKTIQKDDPETGETKFEVVTSFRPGFLNNFDSGLNENFNNSFNVKNLAPSKKGVGYRIGEGLGTLVRGMAGSLGDAYITGASGLDAGLNRQNVRVADKLYRDELNKFGIDTSNLKGYINDNTFKNISTQSINNMKMINARDIAQAKDNRERAKMILDGVKNGTITPESASLQIKLYGITDADLTASNESRKTDAIVETTLNPKPKVVEMRYSGLPTDKTITVKNTYEQLGGTGGKYKPAEGTTATNPQTGETLIYRSGKWQNM